MRIRSVVVAVAAIVSIVASGCATEASDSRQAATEGSTADATIAMVAPPATVAETTTTTVPCQPAPIERRAAAVLVVGIGNATAAGDPLPVAVTSIGVGGVILLGPNVENADQVRALIEGMRYMAGDLLVTVDEEGGRVSRLRAIVGSTESARTLGQRPLPEISAAATTRGTTLHDLGFDLSWAPVVDADGGPSSGAIGDRSFAATPGEAGVRAGAFAAGLGAAGVMASAKHFPGQGGLADSHDGTVVSDQPVGDLRAAAAAAFQPAIDAGVGAVMMSHVTFSSLGALPASLEPNAYQFLRSLGFGGVAVTDSLGMSAIAERWSIPDAAVLALSAGADLLLTNDGTQAAPMRDAIVGAVHAGFLPEARLDEAVRRVLTLRGQDPATMLCG